MEVLSIPAFLPWPDTTAFGGYEFPFRTVAMLSGLVAALVISRATGSIDPPRPIRGRRTS